MSDQLSSSLEVIILGSGGSCGIPEVGCLIKKLEPGEERCECCSSTVDQGNGEGIKEPKNVRGNTSAIFRKNSEDGKTTTILIDCGKSWKESALKYWALNGISKIDAVLLTHLHCDATLGLDDLRTLTLHACVQDSIDIYCDFQTMKALKGYFPHLFPSSNPGGWPPTLNWKVIQHDKKFSIGGIEIESLPVQHGTVLQEIAPGAVVERVPLMISSFVIDEQMIYMSDVSCIPEATWAKLLPHGKAGNVGHRKDYSYPLFIVDCTYIKDVYHSHFDIATALEAIIRLNPANTFLVGMCHQVMHSKLEALCKEIGGAGSEKDKEWVDETIKKHLKENGLFDRAKAAKVKVGPAYDGLRLRIKDGKVTDY